MMEFAFLPGIGPMEIAVIAVIALLVLGPSRLPEAARSLGKGMKEMRDSFAGTMDSDDDRAHLEDDDDLDDDDDLFVPGDEIDEDPELDSEDDEPVDDEPAARPRPRPLLRPPSRSSRYQKLAVSRVPSSSSSSMLLV